MQCLSFCIAQGIDVDRLDRKLRGQSYQTSRYHDVVQLSIAKGKNLCFFFKNGTIVTWGVKKNQVHEFIAIAEPFCDSLLPIYHRDGIIFRFGDKLKIYPHDYFNAEILILDEEDIEIKLALSYGFSQSIKLKMYEQMMESLVEKYSPIIKQISKGRKIPVSRKSILGIISRILEAKSMVNLKSGFAYQPTFIWQHPNVESYYLLIERYLDIPKRLDVLNSQLDTLNEVFDMMNTYLENRHSHFLEIIIIVLIVTEIVFNVLHLQL